MLPHSPIERLRNFHEGQQIATLLTYCAKRPNGGIGRVPPDDVKAELLRRVENLTNETLIPSDKAFEELQRRARERNRPKPA